MYEHIMRRKRKKNINPKISTDFQQYVKEKRAGKVEPLFRPKDT